jgi:hypothetical protein
MRDLTKSVTSYTWAMSVFWTQQMFNFLGLGGSGSWDRSTRAFTNITEATADEMGTTMRALFRGGDTLQRGMVDLFLAPFSFGNWCGGTRDGGRRGGENGGDRGWRDGGQRGAEWAEGRGRGWSDGGGGRGDGSRTGAYSDEPRRGDWAATSRDEWSDRGRGSGWIDTAARAATAGVDALQAAVDTTARATRRAADEVTPQSQPTAPAASDPSLGWGPMPR